MPEWAGGNPTGEAPDGESRWYENVEALYRAQIAKEHPNLQFIVLRSFGCGIDALVADAVHDELRGEDRIYAELKIDQIVDLAAVRIRLRSLAYARRQREGEVELHDLTIGKRDAAKQRQAAEKQRELAELSSGRRGDPERTILQIAEDGETVIPLQRNGNRRFPLAGYTDEKGVAFGQELPNLPPPGKSAQAAKKEEKAKTQISSERSSIPSYMTDLVVIPAAGGVELPDIPTAPPGTTLKR